MPKENKSLTENEKKELRKKQSNEADEAIEFLQNYLVSFNIAGQDRRTWKVEDLNNLEKVYDFTPEQIRNILKLPEMPGTGLNSLKVNLANTIKAKFEKTVRDYSSLDTSEENDNKKISLLNDILKFPIQPNIELGLPGRDEFLANFLKEELPSGMFEGKRTIEGDLEEVIAKFTDRNEAELKERLDETIKAKNNLSQQINKKKNAPQKYNKLSKIIGKEAAVDLAKAYFRTYRKDQWYYGLKYRSLEEIEPVIRTLSLALIDPKDKFTNKENTLHWIHKASALPDDKIGAFEKALNAQVKLERFENDKDRCDIIKAIDQYQSVTGKNTKTGEFVKDMKSANARVVIQGNVRLINQPEREPEKPTKYKPNQKK